MSLTETQRQTTRAELYAHYEDSHLSLEGLATLLGTSPKEVRDMLDMKMHHTPEALFYNRLNTLIDLLNTNIIRNGGTPAPYTFLKF